MTENVDGEDRMSSISRCSNFSLKSQQYIAKQDTQMAAMRRAMIAAGLDPDAVLVPDPDLDPDSEPKMNEVTEMEVDARSKKRLPSGSPEGKLSDSTNSGSVSDEEDVPIKEKIPGLSVSDFLKSKEEKKTMTKLQKKNANKKAKRLAKAVANHDAIVQTQAFPKDQAPQQSVHVHVQAQASKSSGVPPVIAQPKKDDKIVAASRIDPVLSALNKAAPVYATSIYLKLNSPLK